MHGWALCQHLKINWSGKSIFICWTQQNWSSLVILIWHCKGAMDCPLCHPQYSTQHCRTICHHLLHQPSTTGLQAKSGPKTTFVLPTKIKCQKFFNHYNRTILSKESKPFYICSSTTLKHSHISHISISLKSVSSMTEYMTN